MNRTMATKMTVMSNEFRTRGSIPGAIRSEIITRSSAWAATEPPPESRFAGGILLRKAGVLQHAGEKPGSPRDRREADVLVGSVRPCAFGAEPVEDRHAGSA